MLFGTPYEAEHFVPFDVISTKLPSLTKKAINFGLHKTAQALISVKPNFEVSARTGKHLRRSW